MSQITTAEQKKQVDEYVTYATNRSERDRMSDVKKITGVFTGAYAEHPFTGNKIPIWVGDYVLAGYGTGAVMAVPAHDSRDFAFANHFNLSKPIVIKPQGEWDFEKESFDGKEGKLINSDLLNGLEVKAAVKKIIEEHGGSVAISNIVPHGAQVRLIFPAKAVHTAATKAAARA